MANKKVATKASLRICRNDFEQSLADTVFKGLEYEPEKIKYYDLDSHTYTPDFKYLTPSGVTILIELKGYFRESREASKYIKIRNYLSENISYPEGFEIVFVFENPKSRHLASRMNLSQWADKYGFKWYSPKTAYKILELE